MNTRTLAAAAAIALSLTGAAAAQTAPDLVNRWIYDQQGDIVGSVRSLADSGRTAVVIVGAYGNPGVHETTLPVSALTVAGGHVTLRNETVQALNAR